MSYEEWIVLMYTRRCRSLWIIYIILKAALQVDLILLMDRFGYPPVAHDDVYKEIFEQAENFKKYANECMRIF